MPLQSPEFVRAGMAIHELLLEAYEEQKRDRRLERRYPFFRPVTLVVGGVRQNAFSREISSAGIGMLHRFDLLPGEIEVAVPSRRGHSVRVRTRLLWSRACGDGWFISGGKFLGIVGLGE